MSPFAILPAEMLRRIDTFLMFEDSVALQRADPHAFSALGLLDEIGEYDSVQTSDDPERCWVGQGNNLLLKRRFSSLPRALACLPVLRQIIVLVSDAQLIPMPAPYDASTIQGSLALMLHIARPFLTPQFETLSLHVDIAPKNVKSLRLFFPADDLIFGLSHLANAPFKTYVEMGLCIKEYNAAEDAPFWDSLVNGMRKAENHVKYFYSYGTRIDCDAEGDEEGYARAHLEVQNNSFSFNFNAFYFDDAI